jgi:hypothetical protein
MSIKAQILGDDIMVNDGEKIMFIPTIIMKTVDWMMCGICGVIGWHDAINDGDGEFHHECHACGSHSHSQDGDE